MSRERKKVDTPSTVEAIRMASASVLGTTTNLGYPLGSAVGSGSMMEENSDTVAMNIAPLVFAIRDTLVDAEGLELLSLEWDLERTPGPGVLPEQLIVAGGSSEGIGSHVVILSWEKGAVDPFKIDAHMQALSKKLSDIESAVISNGMSYETHGLPVLRRFNDRLNRVIFVEMLDRRFQASWDSMQIKSESVDKEVSVTMNFREDFTLLPPGIKVMDRTLLEFFLPREPENALLKHFKHRILTPSGLEAITVKVPEAGRTILSELNTYAYSIEEVDIAETITSLLAEFMGRGDVGLSELYPFRRQLTEFMSLYSETVESYDKIMEEHIGSGKTLSLSDHKTEILEQIDHHEDWFVGFRKNIAQALVDDTMKSLQREFYDVSEVRAWRLRSAIAYFMIYAKRMNLYFSNTLSQFVVVTAARRSFLSAMQRFKEEMQVITANKTDQILFGKFYAELHAQMNAIFDKVSYQGTEYQSLEEILNSINKEMLGAFGRIEIWDLIGFSDVAEIARSEIAAKHTIDQETDTLSESGQSVSTLLEGFEELVIDIIPNVADTLLSKQLMRKVIDKMLSEETTLLNEIGDFIERSTQKPEEWKEEARSWIRDYMESLEPQMNRPQQLLALMRFIHNKVGLGSTAQAIVDKVTLEAGQRERAYQMLVDDWEDMCKLIESENQPIRENNKKREEMITRSEIDYKEEMAQYESDLSKYRAAVEAAKELPEEIPRPVLTEPKRPASLDLRIVEVNNQFPLMEEKPQPEKPAEPPEMNHYIELRNLLVDRLDSMDAAQGRMEEIFTESLKQMLSEASAASTDMIIQIDEDFLEYLRNSQIRSLGKLLPRATRAFLRNQKDQNLLYLVTYEHQHGELTVTVSDNYLRIKGGA